MSNRSLLEFNHDYCPANDAECLALGKAMQSYMRAADGRELPPGVRRYDYRHHSDPDHAAVVADLRSGEMVAVPKRALTIVMDRINARYSSYEPDALDHAASAINKTLAAAKDARHD